MNHARIAELLEPFLSDHRAALSTAQLEFISMYIDILLRWNDRVNLTAIRNREEIVTRHFGESLFAARQLFPQPDVGASPKLHVLDVGSGAGFPGLPTKIWAPPIHLTLIESNQKKATFLREVIRHLGLAHVDVFSARAKAYLGVPGDVVMFRAVEHFESVLIDSSGLVAPNGYLAVMIGKSQLDQARQLVPGLKWEHPISIPLSSNRFLMLGRHVPG